MELPEFWSTRMCSCVHVQCTCTWCVHDYVWCKLCKKMKKKIQWTSDVRTLGRTLCLYNTVKSCIKAAACVQFSDFFSRLIFKTGLYSRQAFVQCCILATITRSHTAHFVHSSLYTLHILCVGWTAAAFIQGRLVCCAANQNGRFLFKTGLYSRAAFTQDFTVTPPPSCQLLAVVTYLWDVKCRYKDSFLVPNPGIVISDVHCAMNMTQVDWIIFLTSHVCH